METNKQFTVTEAEWKLLCLALVHLQDEYTRAQRLIHHPGGEAELALLYDVAEALLIKLDPEAPR